MHSRPVNEIEELQTQEDFPDAVTVGEFRLSARPAQEPSGPIRDRARDR